MKKLIACLALCFMAQFAHAQTDSTRFTWSAGFNLAPQTMYQFGDDKPKGDIGLFATTTLSSKKAAVCLFYGMKNHSVGVFTCRNLTAKWSLYGVGFKDIPDRGKYFGAGTMYQFGQALVFFELGAPIGMGNDNPMISTGLFIGFGKDIKKW